MGQLADVVGIGPLFTRDGKELQVAPIQPYHRALLEARLEKDGWDTIERSRAYVSRETLRESISVYQQDLNGKEYSQGGKVYDRFARSPDGIRYLLLKMLFGVKGQEWISEEWVFKWTEEKPDEAMRCYKQALGIKEEGMEGGESSG